MNNAILNNNNNYCLIMAGGIGSRFWPISRAKYPKQFIDILGTGKTLIQHTFERFSKIIPIENILIVTSEEYRDIIHEQLPQVQDENILGEPMKRNTAPCIMYANMKILRRDPSANIVVTPSDHYVENEEMFLSNISEGLQFISANNSLLTLGIKPNRPATSYGYIQMENNANTNKFISVKTFTEKPHIELAKFFVNSGDFLWNSGIFLWRLNSINMAIEKYLPELYDLFIESSNSFDTDDEKNAVNRIYSETKSVSIDFGVMEDAENVFVLKADFGWSDLGTWNSLYTLQNHDNKGNVVIGNQVLAKDVDRNYINVFNDKKVAIIKDVEDLIIVDTDDALLICKRENEQIISDLLNDAKLKFGDEIK